MSRPPAARAARPDEAVACFLHAVFRRRRVWQPELFSGLRCVVAAASLCFPAPCMALECPAPQAAGAPDAIAETPTQISELARILSSGDLGNRIPVYVHELRSRHPNVSAGDLVNYLITAYCPVVNDMTGLREAEKRARMDAFGSQVAQEAYQ